MWRAQGILGSYLAPLALLSFIPLLTSFPRNVCSLLKHNYVRENDWRSLFSFQAWLLCQTRPCGSLQNLHRLPRWDPVFHQIPSLDGLCCSTHRWWALVHKDTGQVRAWVIYFYHTALSLPTPWSDLSLSSARYRLTAIEVDRAAGPYQNYTVIFVGSEAGVVLKVLAKTSPFSLNDSVLLEEIEAYNQAK